MADVFNLILHSNLFNFAIFLLIIIVICVKVDVPRVLEQMREKVSLEINNSKNAKSSALTDLEKANTEYSKLPEELQNISENAQLKMDSLSDQIYQETEQKISDIEKNTQNILNAERKYVTSDLISRLGLKSVEQAKADIIAELQLNPKLHNKFIDESISKLDEVVL